VAQANVFHGKLQFAQTNGVLLSGYRQGEKDDFSDNGKEKNGAAVVSDDGKAKKHQKSQRNPQDLAHEIHGLFSFPIKLYFIFVPLVDCVDHVIGPIPVDPIRAFCRLGILVVLFLKQPRQLFSKREYENAACGDMRHDILYQHTSESRI
jgi:hypothetical protein